jgi:hypothetical protein
MEISMPISLRLPVDVETQIAGFGARQGLTKSAVIVRSIQEYLAKHAQPSSFEIYEDVMQGTAGNTVQKDALREAAEQRPLKQQVRDAIRRKHAERSKRAAQAAATSSRTNRKAA